MSLIASISSYNDHVHQQFHDILVCYYTKGVLIFETRSVCFVSTMFNPTMNIFYHDLQGKSDVKK